MKLFFALLFGAGVASFVYSKMGRRLGYANQKNVWTVVLITFVIASIVFYTVLALFLSNDNGGLSPEIEGLMHL